MRVTTIRLPEELAEQVELVARVDGVSVSEVIREAIAAHLEARKLSDEFRARFAERIEADKQILERLS